MAMKDIFPTTDARLALSKAFASGDGTKAVEGNVIDIYGFNSVLFVVSGEYAATDTAEIVLSVMHSDDNVDFVAAEGDYIVGPSAAISGEAPVQKVGYVGARRYVKLVATPSAAAGTTIKVTAHAILQSPALSPV